MGVEVVSGELPLERWRGDLSVLHLESMATGLRWGNVAGVVGRQEFALSDSEMDLDLAEAGGRAAVRAAIVDAANVLCSTRIGWTGRACGTAHQDLWSSRRCVHPLHRPAARVSGVMSANVAYRDHRGVTVRGQTMLERCRQCRDFS